MIDIWKVFCGICAVLTIVPFLHNINRYEMFAGNLLGCFIMWYLIWYLMERYYFKTPTQKEIDEPDLDEVS